MLEVGLLPRLLLHPLAVHEDRCGSGCGCNSRFWSFCRCRSSRGLAQRLGGGVVGAGGVSRGGRPGDASAACQLFDGCHSTRTAAPPRMPPLPSALKRSANADLAALVRRRKRECVAMRRTGVYMHDSDDSLIIAAAVDARER